MVRAFATKRLSSPKIVLLSCETRSPASCHAQRCSSPLCRGIVDGFHKFGQRDADFVRSVFLKEVSAFNRDFRMVRPGATEMPRPFTDDGPGIAENEQLRNFGPRKPFTVTLDDCVHIGRLTVDWDLTRPHERRQPRIPLPKWRSVGRHFLFAEFSDHRLGSDSLDENILVDDHVLALCRW